MNPIIQWAKEPWFWEKAETEEDNIKYQSEITTPLSEQKDRLLWDGEDNPTQLFWRFKEKPTKIEANKSDIDSNEIAEKIEENPHSPLIDSFVKQWILEIEDWEKIKEAFYNNEDIESALDDVEGVDDVLINALRTFIVKQSSKEEQEKNQKMFDADFATEIEELKVPSIENGADEKELSWHSKFLVESLGANYFPLNNVDGSPDTRKIALSRSFATTLNQVMDWKIFKRPDNFNKMKDIVKNPDLDFKTRFEELLKISNLVTDDQSRANGKQQKKYWEMQKWNEKAKRTLQERYDDFRLAAANKKIETEAIIKLIKEWEAIKSEVKEESGEVFKNVWEIDKLLKDLDDKLTEQKEEA